MDETFTALAAALRKRLAIISDETSRRDLDRHTARFREVSKKSTASNNLFRARSNPPAPPFPATPQLLKSARFAGKFVAMALCRRNYALLFPPEYRMRNSAKLNRYFHKVDVAGKFRGPKRRYRRVIKYAAACAL